MDRFEWGCIGAILLFTALALTASVMGTKQRCETYGSMTSSIAVVKGGQCYANRGSGWELVYLPGETH